MKKFDFTLGFAVMAENEIDARVKLKDLLMAISKEEILKAMRLVKGEEAMSKDIFRTVRELLDSRDNVLIGNAVSIEGPLYGDSVENLHALQMLEPSLIELVRICVDSGLKCTALDEVIELIGFEGWN
jgi:hypothetical protein